jgi:hypothetical protein
MTDWTNDELDAIGSADELHLASRRRDGSLRRFATIWVVRLGDDLYVRSAHGVDNPWFRRAVASGTGRIRAARVERDVEFVPATAETGGPVDAAYHAKYDHYGARFVDPVVGDDAAAATLRLVAA